MNASTAFLNGLPLKLSLFLGALFGFLAVALGAFGAHALASRLSPRSMEIYQTGVQYQTSHACVLISLGLFSLLAQGLLSRSQGQLTQSPLPLDLASPLFLSHLNLASLFFSIGILVFSGSLYALALTDIKILGAITPIGGVCFLLGWSYLIRAGWMALP